MCAIDDCDPWKVWRQMEHTARKKWRCCECRRTIGPGERYHHLSALGDWGGWQDHRWCAHCDTAGRWLHEVCNGYPVGMLGDELVGHWDEGYRSIAFASLVVGQRHGWRDGRDPVPDRAAVVALAQRMLADRVAAA